MADSTPITFSYKDIVEMLIKKQGIHEGIWGIHVAFRLHGANVTLGEAEPLPASVVQITGIGLQPAVKVNSLSVDAAEVNPAPNGTKKASKKQGTAKK
ncbi:MAG TPA: hypothetical protein VEZ40_18795 [Pyrinomonadaceae bacterium]|nr:hypothetical protein [Pyrinomonadaceae bacterium]